ncbi:MAG: LytTR family transcriptional regulator [Rhizobiales bacterium]|nr:LytTR family transcriptional regulator [Hyphomicrobiales bacterium]
MTSGSGYPLKPEPATRLVRWKILAVLAAVLLAVAVVNAVTTVDDAARFAGRALSLPRILLWELSSVVVIFALVPLIRWGALHVRGGSGTAVARALLINIGTILVFTALHIAGMVVLRKIAHGIAGYGPYIFDLSLANLIYELRKDALTYLLIGATFWLNESWSHRRPQADGAAAGAGPVPASQAAAAEASLPQPAVPQAFWLRDGTTSIRIDPAAIVWVQSAGNYVEYLLTGGRRHLVRGTLRAEEERLRPHGIVRVHRTRLVNPTRITRIDMRPSGDAELRLETGETIAGSRRYGLGESLKQAVQAP